MSSGFFTPLDEQRRLLDLDVELVLAEAGDRHGDAVLVIAEPLDVVGRVAVGIEPPTLSRSWASRSKPTVER